MPTNPKPKRKKKLPERAYFKVTPENADEVSSALYAFLMEQKKEILKKQKEEKAEDKE